MAAKSLVVCVPARNEAERLPRLLEALAAQSERAFVTIISLNNTTDESRAVVAAAASHHRDMTIVVDETQFEPAQAHAGSARKRAMNLAAEMAGPHGYILTTDADTRPPPDWIAQNLAAMARGLDVVGGRIVIDEDEPLSEAMASARHLADLYWARVREIEDAIDPVAWDPQPRHGDHTGASLCMTVAAYRQCGGVPQIPSGEDRALVRAALRAGGKLAHPIGIWTRVSPRIEGRAIGGMADHMKRMQTDTRANADIVLPSFAQWTARAEWRRAVRAQGGSVSIVELENDLPPMQDDMVLSKAAFG